MAQTSPNHGPHASGHQRPRGILKNSHSYQAQTSPTRVLHPEPERPGLARELSEKEITIHNTLQNAGAHRRSSSNARAPPSRRQSGTTLPHLADENSPRLKWDEANLYLTEQERDSTMKITEPKTPYARQYDPSEDEAEISALNADELMVDELDTKKKKPSLKEDDIPGLDLGEPELDDPKVHTPDGDKRVMVEPDFQDQGHHGEETEDMTPEEREKHRKFEEMRKKHYEMKNVKNLLGHPQDADEDDEEGLPALPGSGSGSAMDTK